MDFCDFCGNEITLPYKCPFCGGSFCDDHRLPPNHDCIGIEFWRKRQPPNKKLIRRKGRPEFSTIEIQTVKLSEFVPYIPDSVLPALTPDEPLEGWEKYGLAREDVDDLYRIPLRKYCYYCGKRIWNDLQFVCSHCDLSFCEEHRTPEDHGCLDKRKYILPPGIGYYELLNMCEFCGSVGVIERCQYCGKAFCKEHLYPSSHNCEKYTPHKVRLHAGVIDYVATKEITPKSGDVSVNLDKKDETKKESSIKRFLKRLFG
ncbi:MAG: hypothetical protein H0Z28_08300 [Archaeoglobus sp.]|nr:hypothetical protein [Archaeoglobus sp.]